MHKSLYFTLLLIGYLLMSTFTLNINLIPNAMAQDYSYDADSSDNNYYDDNSKYSKYPTQLNKYECQKGPFEGFFVSSVEFCKHFKIDDSDRKDKRSGAIPL